VSIAYQIQQMLYDVLVNDEPYFASFYTQTTRMVQIQPEQIPYLGVYLLQDRKVPDGDAGQGMTRFKHTATIAFSVMVSCNDAARADAELDFAEERINTRIFCDPHIMNKIADNTPNHVVIDTIESSTIDRQMGNAQLDNETPLAELRYQLLVGFRDYWYPAITDDFLRYDVYTRLNGRMSPIKTKLFFDPETGAVSNTPPPPKQP
jgi:hypothetical protein